MSKMFVHYSGTVDAFKSIASQYDNKIVFIKGGANGEGAAIYTHGKYYGDVKDALAALQLTVGGLKYFTSIKAGDTTASAPGKDGVITFNAADPAQVSVDVDSHGVNIGLSKTFTDAVAANTSGLAGEITRATEAEGKIRTDLGQKGDAANAEGSAFARIAKLVADINAMTGGNGSIADQIKAAVELLDVDMVGGGENEYIASIKQEDGKIVATKGTLNFDVNGAAAQALADAKNYADGLIAKDSAFEKRVAANESAISVLNGEGDGSVKKQVADAIAGVIASAPEDFDTLKEVADWIASDTTGATKMQADIAKLNGADTVEGSVAKQIKDAKTDITNIITENEETTAQAYSELNDRVGALEEQSSLVDSALQASDITTGSANGTIAVKEIDVKVKGLGSAAYTEANAYATAALGTLAEAAAPQATTYTKAEVDGMWNWEEL